jgi:steroid 5-alpha reductase family enzyme
MSRSRALLSIIWAYLVAFSAATACLIAFEQHDIGSLLSRLVIADLLATFVVFGFSVRHDNSSVYDAYWSVLPIWLVGCLGWIAHDGEAEWGRVLLVSSLVLAWGIRLTHNWARGWSGLDHEDWRYVDMRARTGRLYWLVSLFGLHLFPTVMVALACAPIVVACTWPSQPLGWLDALAAIATSGAIVIELLADNTLRSHVLRRERPGETLREGVWAWSRHPNYLGEIGFWWGMVLFGVAAVGLQPWWMAVGALLITCMFNFISIPLIETRMAKRRSDWDTVRREVPRLLPIVGRRS